MAIANQADILCEKWLVEKFKGFKVSRKLLGRKMPVELSGMLNEISDDLRNRYER